MTDLGKILAAYRELARSGEEGVLATVVHVEGSAYRRPGARMLWRRDGRRVGTVTGGCLEAEIGERAAEVLAAGTPMLRTYDLRSPDDVLWGSGLGCPGVVRVLLEPAAGPLPVDLVHVERLRAERCPGVVATVYASPGEPVVGTRAVGAVPWLADGAAHVEGVLARRRSRSIDGELGILVEYVAPPPALVLFGAGDDARPLVSLAADAGWSVRVLDHREAYAVRERFPAAEAVETIDPVSLDVARLAIDDRTAVVVMTHHFLNDVEILARVLPSTAAYVGILGPARRARDLRDRLAARGIAFDDSRWHAPAGLDIGSETPEEIALSVLAEARAVLSGRHGGPLRERSGPLHGDG